MRHWRSSRPLWDTGEQKKFKYSKWWRDCCVSTRFPSPLTPRTPLRSRSAISILLPLCAGKPWDGRSAAFSRTIQSLADAQGEVHHIASQLSITANRLMLLVLVIMASPCIAQTPSVPSSAKTTAVPAITFSFDFAQSQPSNYSIIVQSSGEAKYQSAAPEDTGTAPDITTFTMSATTRSQIFDLAQRARFFEGNFNYKGKVADTGTKTLAFDDE